MNTHFDAILHGLLDHGYAIADHFLDNTLVEGLRNRAQQNNAKGLFKTAAIGNATNKTLDTQIRNDQIQWIDETTTNPFENAFLQQIDALIQELNRSAFLGIRSKEFHFAVYKPGAFYQKHLDAFKHQNQRVVSIICYLNTQWDATMGGTLRMHLDDGVTDVLPLGGRIVCFLSQEIPHEVLPATQTRYSITGWLKRE